MYGLCLQEKATTGLERGACEEQFAALKRCFLQAVRVLGFMKSYVSSYVVVKIFTKGCFSAQVSKPYDSVSSTFSSLIWSCERRHDQVWPSMHGSQEGRCSIGTAVLPTPPFRPSMYTKLKLPLQRKLQRSTKKGETSWILAYRGHQPRGAPSREVYACVVLCTHPGAASLP